MHSITSPSSLNKVEVCKALRIYPRTLDNLVGGSPYRRLALGLTQPYDVAITMSHAVTMSQVNIDEPGRSTDCLKHPQVERRG